MSFASTASLEKHFKGSFEDRIGIIKESIEAAMGCSVPVLATHADHALVLDPDGKFHEVHYGLDESNTPQGIQPYDADVEVVPDEEVDRFVSRELRDVTEAILSGEDVCTRVHALLDALEEEETYWLSDVRKLIDEATTGQKWREVFDVKGAEIRESLWGNIREIEKPIPKTRYAKVAPEKLSEIEAELRESVKTIADALLKVVDSGSSVVFNDDVEGATHQSLLAEAQALAGLLCKAERLTGSRDLVALAETHDGLAERARDLLVMAEHLNGRSSTEEASK